MSNPSGINKTNTKVDSCATCRHWIGSPAVVDTKRDPVARECRRFPPVPMPVERLDRPHSAWPRTYDYDHCGEFSRCDGEPTKSIKLADILDDEEERADDDN